MRVYSTDPLVKIYQSGNVPYVNNSSEGTGMVRWSTRNNSLEVWDGSSWQRLYGDVDVQLDPQIKYVLDWAHRKIQEDRELDALCQKHPGLQDARDQLEIMRRLVKQPQNS